MSYHPLTMFEEVSARRADLLREADCQSLAEQAMLDLGSHSRPLIGSLTPFIGSFDTITAALRRWQRVTATRLRRNLWTLPA